MLKIISPVSDVFRKDFEIDTTHLSTDPTHSGSKMITEAGRWVKIASGQAAHVNSSGPGSAGAAVNVVSTGAGGNAVQMVQIWNDKGDYGMQALSKVTTFYLGQYEATTDIFHAGIGEGDLLTVDEQGQLTVANAANEFVVGQCSKVDSTAGTINFVRFASPYPLH
tara:strand:- start:259 stop:756 length:498 start_codon:yes stop_codon:yes gene_type:complete